MTWGKGITSFLTCGHLIVLTQFVENTILSPIEFPGTVVKKLIDYKSEGLFLDNQFCPTELYV